MSTYGLWLSAAGMKVQSHRQDVLANNLANINTTGFKQDFAVVTQRRIESQESPGRPSLEHSVLDGLPGGLNVYDSYHDFAQGSIEKTGRPLDVAIDGEGFFGVTDGTSMRYTRDGQFTLNKDGGLVLSAGKGKWKVVDDAGAPILIDRTAGAFEVSQDGSIRQGKAVVAKIGLFASSDQQQLHKDGTNLFDAGDEEMAPIDGRVIPKARETSNADVMKGLVQMMEASRAYQLNATMIQLQDRTTEQAVNTVGRLA